MSLEDPFYTVRDDVRQSLSNAQSLYSQWCMLLEAHSDLEKLETVTTDLRSCIKSIEWDLQDLDETIAIAEANQHKFKLTGGELDSRRHFIRDTRQIVKKMKDHVQSDAAQEVFQSLKRKELLGSRSQRKGHGRYQRLEDEMERSNQDFIEHQKHQQEMLVVQQDRQLEKVGESVGVLHQMGQDIGVELDEQNKMIEEIDEDMERTESRLIALTKRVDKAIRNTSDRCQIICIVVLVVVIIIIVIMFFVPFSG